ncbi:MAG: alpha/beta hydrolase [Flammeovirgaceae bacterium]|nr:alpha/beta hydrolase [Flammeovirgaceae bacterium]
MKVILGVLFLFITNFAFSQTAISVTTSGTGKPIIFLPGFTSPGSIWDETIPNLEGNYESHVVSYAGFNGLKPIGTPWYSTIKAQLVAYVKNEKLSNITLVGHSMGGNLAIDLASELKDHISGLILVESIPCMRELMMPGVPASSLQYDSPYNNQVLSMSDEEFKQMALGMAQNMTNDTSKIGLLTEWSVIADRETYVYGYTDLLKLDLRTSLSELETETLILGASFPNKEITQSNYENTRI